MTSEVLVAIIAAAGGLLGSILGMIASSRLMSFRVEQLEKKVDKHNNLIERMYRLENQAKLNIEGIQNNIRRIEDLEEEIDDINRDR